MNLYGLFLNSRYCPFDKLSSEMVHNVIPVVVYSWALDWSSV